MVVVGAGPRPAPCGAEVLCQTYDALPHAPPVISLNAVSKYSNTDVKISGSLYLTSNIYSLLLVIFGRGTSAAAFSATLIRPAPRQFSCAAFLWEKEIHHAAKRVFSRARGVCFGGEGAHDIPGVSEVVQALGGLTGYLQQAYVNGVSQGHLTGIRVPDYDGPITDVTSNDIICNGGINPYHTPLPSTVITVPAGAQFTAEWHHSLVGPDPSDSADPVDPTHHGPTITYLAQIPNALQSTVTGLKWFKIQEDGLVASNQTWGVDRMIANKGKVTFTIPPCIPAGQYLLRHEMIALHSATTYPGAQFYMECAQLSITGGGSTQPATVSFPGAYKGSDPGITTNIYYPLLTNYTVPGPPVFTCPGGSGTTVKPSSTVKPASSSTVKSSSATKSSSSAATTTGATAPHYGQCGGFAWAGPTVCASPYTCTYVNVDYSQCL
ncbi:CBM1 domain-containing protein [Mycena indigotica]|uniref:AA9 family lytic polysaccharide monooxygenase n=1 Tax=Mycena indigotica TaxID=2126181 RepID=A0A8H6T3A2_9AGAR|nr:CBM1 domain-containing protein [Mycena indigotica]KAF7310251.1 CBM1 domain-containing protein [Mycena indigotica]